MGLRNISIAGGHDGSRREWKTDATALGLIALVCARELDATAVHPDVLRGLGHFLLATQHSRERSLGRREEQGRPRQGAKTLPREGKVLLALATLHRVDPDPRWNERGQVEVGTHRGGFTRTFPRESTLGCSGVRRSEAHHEIRIDYVQHAVAAMLAFESRLPDMAPEVPGAAAFAAAR